MLVSLALAAACVPAAQTPVANTAEGTYAVDPAFRELYVQLGGEDVLGPAISDDFYRDGVKMQYLQAGLMVYNAQATASQQYSFAPLGLEFGFSDSPSYSGQPTDLVVDGYTVFAPFVPTYHRLNGARFLGRPLTEVRFNAEKNRYEQYFENMGFFVRADDPSGAVRLLAYGVENCNLACRYQAAQDSLINEQSRLAQPFASAVSKLGATFIGKQLTGPYAGRDGSQEVIFENLVLYQDPADPNRVLHRPLALDVGMPPTALVTRLENPFVIFWPLEGDNLGHNVPTFFSDYLIYNLALEIAGPPITELFPLQENVARQCFMNLCLDYFATAAEGDKVRPAPLGLAYKQIFFDSQNGEGPNSGPRTGIEVRLWEAAPLISSQQGETIYVHISENGAPLANIEPRLVIILPDGSRYPYQLPPTGADGQTSLTVLPISAPNGTVIAYKVCVELVEGDKICSKENYVIWGNPGP